MVGILLIAHFLGGLKNFKEVEEMHEKKYEIRVVDNCGCIVATVPVFGTLAEIISGREQIISFILSILQSEVAGSDPLFLSKVEEGELLFFELYCAGQYITTLN